MRRALRLAVGLALALALVPLAAPAQEAGTHLTVPVKARKTPIVITGDKLEIEPNETYIVTGNVFVSQGSQEITCEKGTYNERTGLAQAIHNVKLRAPKFSVDCKRLDSHTRENFSIFSGNVVIDGERVKVFGEKANYYEKEEKLIVIGDPRSVSKDDPPNVVTGRRITYFFKTDRAKVTGDVKADLQPKKGNLMSSPTHITGESLTILPDRRYQVEGNLVAKRSDTTLSADRGIYDDTREITEAFGSVKVETPKYVLESGYMKNFGLEERTIANVHPKLTQITERKNKKKRKSRILGGDTDDENGPSKDRVILTAVEIEAVQGGVHVIARNDCVMKQTPYLGDDSTEEVTATSTIKADLMDIYSEEGKVVAKGRVELTGHDILATGDRAVYFEEKDGRPEELIIEGNAKATQKKPNQAKPNVSTGEKIHYFPVKDKVIIEQAKAEVYRKEADEKLPEITDEVKLEKKTYRKRGDKSEKSATAETELTAPTGEVALPKAAPAGTTEVTVRRARPSMTFGR